MHVVTLSGIVIIVLEIVLMLMYVVALWCQQYGDYLWIYIYMHSMFGYVYKHTVYVFLTTMRRG